jgi:hypothetical protein
MLPGALLLAGCRSELKVGALQTESRSVEQGNAGPVRVEITMGAGDLEVAGGAQKLVEADFVYNVARLKPEVKYTNDTLIVQQPEVEGLPAVGGISDFRNEWNLHLNKDVPMDLSVDLGAGTSNLQLAGLSLTRLGVSVGASKSTVDLSGDWAHNLDVTIEAGAADISVVLPKNVGVRVKVESGPHAIDASGLTQDGDVFTNAAYGVSGVTLQINIKAGIGKINLDIGEADGS